MSKKNILKIILLDTLLDLGGTATILEISKHIVANYSKNLERHNTLVYTWQYDLRWAANYLRKEGLLKSAKESKKDKWEIHPEKIETLKAERQVRDQYELHSIGSKNPKIGQFSEQFGDGFSKGQVVETTEEGHMDDSPKPNKQSKAISMDSLAQRISAMDGGSASGPISMTDLDLRIEQLEKNSSNSKKTILTVQIQERASAVIPLIEPLASGELRLLNTHNNPPEGIDDNIVVPKEEWEELRQRLNKIEKEPNEDKEEHLNFLQNFVSKIGSWLAKKIDATINASIHAMVILYTSKISGLLNALISAIEAIAK